MADWIKISDVKQRLGVAETAKGYEDIDIQDRISRAQKRIKAKLQATISIDTTEGWDADTVPPIVAEWTADLAASYILSDYAGQALLDKMTLAGSLFSKVEIDLEAVRLGKLQIVDTTNASVEPAVDVISSTTQDKTPHYSMNNPGDSTYGDGTLDEL
jgi:hypothetical protein